MARLVLIDVSEASEKAGVTRQSIYRWIEVGLGDEGDRQFLTATRVGGSYYIDPDDLNDYTEFRDDYYAGENM